MNLHHLYGEKIFFLPLTQITKPHEKINPTFIICDRFC